MNTEEKWKEKAEEKRSEDRKRLFAFDDVQAEGLSMPDRYQRMRYQREIEAAEWLAEIQRRIPQQREKESTKKKRFTNTKTIYRNWTD